MNEERILEAKKAATEALKDAMVGPVNGHQAKMLAPYILEAIIADKIPGVKAVFLGDPC